MDVEYPQILVEFLAIFNQFSLDFIPDIIPQISGEMSAPAAFQREDYNSLFLQNTQDYITAILSLLTGYAVLKISLYLMKDVKTQNSRA